jgi:undecaprenol kinase
MIRDMTTPPPPPSASDEHPDSPHPHSPEPRNAIVKVAKSFTFALAGVGYLLRTQRNARLHLIAFAAVLALTAWLGASPVEWAMLVVVSLGMLVLEAINTAIEATVDLACPQRHPLAKAAKDVAAAAVLLGSVASVIVGLLILGPPLMRKLSS